jgi:hypothetical protein
MASTTTSMSNLASSPSANAAYVRHQGLNNSNSSTIAQRAKTFTNHFNSASVNNITATNAGSFSKLKSTFSKKSKENNFNSSSSVSTQNLNDLTPPVNGSKKNNYPGSLKIDHSSKGLKIYNEPASPVSTTSTIESIKQSLNLAANQHSTNNNRNFATLPLNKTSKLNSVSNGNLHLTSNISGSSSTAINYVHSNNTDNLHSSTLLMNKRKTLSISSSSTSSSTTNLNNDDDTLTNQLASYSAYSYNKPPEPLKQFSSNFNS